MQLTTIKLGGVLGKKYGKTFKMAARTPSEAIQMLAATFKTFMEDLGKYNYRVVLNKDTLDEDSIKAGLNITGKCIRFIPKFVGSGNYGRIVAGVVLVLIGTFVVRNPALVQAGYGLIIGGVIGLMFGTNPSSNNDSEDSNKTSYLFGGTVNTTGQGNPVPILYGRRLVGSQVISAGISTRAI